MLAYLFWHWPSLGQDRRGYEGRVMEYHRLLSSVNPEGFHGSVSFRVNGVPWAAEGGHAYEDWYLVEAAFALDTLNEAAVTGPMAAPHRAAVRGVEGMAAGLYRLRAGDAKVAPARFGAWFSKPRGAGDAELDGELSAWTSRPGVSLWRRQMVLGPTPEFCLVGVSGEDLPPTMMALNVDREAIWPGPGRMPG